MAILQTEVLPIEYDASTTKKAQKTKAWLNTNPSFFKAFLPRVDRISYINPNNALYIRPRESILTHLEGITAEEAIGILQQKPTLTENDKKLLLMYLWNEKVGGKYNCSKMDSKIMQDAAAKIYYCDRKNYDAYHSYLLKDDEKSKTEVFNWFQEQYRFPLLDYMLRQQLQILKNYYLPKTKENHLKELSEMIDISLWETTKSDAFSKEQKITYPVSKEKSLSLAKEFLTEIDPTLTCLSEFKYLEDTKSLVEDPTDKRLNGKKKQPLNWHLFYSNEQNWCIYAPWRHTLEDSISLIHEFFHYLACKNEIASNKTVFQLSEFPSLFFETLMCEFLINKGYPKEEVNKYKDNRTLEVAQYGMDIEGYLTYLKLLAEEKQITLETKIALAKEIEQEFQEFNPEFSFEKSYQKSLENIVKEDVDEEISNLLLMPEILLESYPYIIGKRYSDIMICKSKENNDVIPQMLTLTERICDMSKEDVLQELGLISPEKGSSLIKK